MLNCMLQRRLNEWILGADVIISGGSQAKLDLVEQQCYGTGRQVYRYIIQAFIIDIYISIYKFVLSVCLYPINVKTAEPIGSKFVVGHHVTTGKAYEW